MTSRASSAIMAEDRCLITANICFKLVFLLLLSTKLTVADLHDRIDDFLLRYNGGRISRNLKFVDYEDLMGDEFAEHHRKKRSSREPGDQFEWRVKQVLQRNVMKGSANMEMFVEHWGVGDNDGRGLFLVLYYLMHHKFYDFDWRQYRGKNTPNTPSYGHRYSKEFYRVEIRNAPTIGLEPELGFQSHFPTPVIENWPSELVEACTDSVHRCVREIAYVANQNDELYLLLGELEIEYPTRINDDINQQRRKFVYTENWRRERKFIDIGHQPWKNREAAFAFATVASYFLCFYALQREGFLISIPFDPHCHRMMIYSMKGYAEVQFGCAELAFCADPCWGESKYGYDIVLYEFESGIRMGKPTHNPCWQMKGGKNNMCNLLNTFSQPVSFMDLQMSKLNYSCNCTTGFRYSMITRQCEDIDECEDTVLNTCDGEKFEVCRNAIGLFHCSCQRGYIAENETAPCVRNEKMALYDMKKDYGYIEVMQEKHEAKSGDKFLKKLHDLKYLPKRLLDFLKDKLAIVFPHLKYQLADSVGGT